MFVDFPVRTKSPLSANQFSKTMSAGQVEEPTGRSRNLAPKEVLFRDGDRRTWIYRVERGAICLYEPRWNDDRSVIDFAFPGDYVGLGFLETQSCNASAICECRVKCIPWDQLSSAIAGNSSAQQKLHEATEREFELRRTSIVRRGQERPIERVAAFLIALSRNNAIEGREPAVIGNSMGCGIAADYLSLSIEKLGALLAELRKRGLIDLCPDKSLRILDIEALQELADQHDGPLSASRPRLRCPGGPSGVSSQHSPPRLANRSWPPGWNSANKSRRRASCPLFAARKLARDEVICHCSRGSLRRADNWRSRVLCGEQ